MGFRFRKSFGKGPFRITLSKSGVGYSAGVKGFRMTKKSGGGIRTTASIPGTGISYVSETKKTAAKPSSYNKNDTVKTEDTYMEPQKIARKLGRWSINTILGILTGFFLIGALTFLPHYSALFFFLAAVLVVPITKWRKMFPLPKIRWLIVLVLFLIGCCSAPTTTPNSEHIPTTIPSYEELPIPDEEPTITFTVEPTEAPSPKPTNVPTNEPTRAPTKEPTKAPTKEPTKAPTKEPTEKPAASNVEYVYITNGGSKYHRSSECSNMKNPSRITKEEAIDSGRTACGKCY